MFFPSRLAKFVNFILIACMLMTGTFLMHYTLSNLNPSFSSNIKINSNYQEQQVLIENLPDFDDDDHDNFLEKLKRQIHELWRIKGSVTNELQSMELKRNQLLTQIEQLTNRMNKSQTEIVKITSELNQLKNSIEQAQLAKKELLIENTPDLALPLVLKSSHYPIDRIEPQNSLELSTIAKEVLEHLESLAANKVDKFSIYFKCDFSNDDEIPVNLNDWFLCGTESTRKTVLNKSTFVLIFCNSFENYSFQSTAIFQTRIYEALQTGAIPVILDGFPSQMPYSETIDWRKACIFLPFARVTELHFLLRSILDSDLLEIRRQGRLIWQTYLSTMQTTIDTILSVLRNRIGIPANPIQSFNGTSVFNSTFQPLKIPVSVPVKTETEEILGPIEAPYSSPSFKRNFSSIFFQSYDLWNRYFIPFRMFPQLPFDPFLPSEAKFTGSNYGFRPINKGAGGSGKEFSEALGGNYPREQLTIVILTYEREKILLSNLNRLSGLPYLNKIIIVWNSLKAPSEDMKWPDLSVPVDVIKAKVNSLNNRFLPFNNIETEAVLLMDDDVMLRHDEIIFAFRVWRENRDRIVGFPARYHAWDIHMNNSWFYNSNYSCELSMVLTGAAFVHNFYLYLYWNWFPEAIRDKVDELMNCEDIAMNFLVSHLTRKPPIKVTSRWTFRCPECPIILSEFESHFSRRHECINYFSKVLGYNPLLYTQYRADSVLFKTRISRNKQKCFKYV